jgi:hypothetical protein
MVAQAYNPSNQEAEAGRSQVKDQLGLYIDPVPKEKRKSVNGETMR